MRSARFWLACGASSVLMAACGSSDSTHSDRDTPDPGGAGGEQAEAGAPPVAGAGASSGTGGTGGTTPLPEGGTGGGAEGGDGGTPTDGGAPIVQGGAGAGPGPVTALVEPKYPTNGAYWLDYVKNDSTDVTTASDTACDAATDGPFYEDCVHGGEIRRLALPDVADCTDVSASDALAAFDWACQLAGAGIEVVSTGLRAGKHMSDLLDFQNNTWKLNALTVTRDGEPLVESEPAAWWANPIERLAGASCTVDRGAEHSIFLLDAASSNANCTGATGKIGLASVPGETVTDFRWNRRGSFNWAEGAYTLTAQHATLSANDGGAFQVVRNASFTATAPGTGNAVAIAMGQTRASLVRDITASGGRIIVGAGSAVGFRVTDVVSTGARVDAISFSACTDCTITNVELSNTGNRAILVQGAPRLVIRDVVAQDNVGGGIFITDVTNGRVEDVRVARSGAGGVVAQLSSSTIFKSIVVDGAVGVGVSVDQGYDNRLVDIHVGNAGANGIYLTFDRHVLQHARVSCGKGLSVTTGTGVLITSSQFTRMQDVTTAGCRYGIDMNGNAHMAQAVTVAATEDVGVRSGGYAQLFEDVAAIDTTYGLYFLSQVFVPPRVRSFASTHNFNGSVYSNNSTLDIAEKLIVGNNGPTATSPDCVTTSTTGLNNACGGHTATLTTGASVLASIVGLVSDPTNPQGATGSSPYTAITSFTTFGAETRRYIRAGAGFPDYNARGPCTGTETCSILDLALKATDTLLRNRNALPTGDDVTTHNWFIANNDPVDQAACEARVPGSVLVVGTPNRCESVFLKHAWELLEDGIGDNDGFCESGETCEVARNIGGYQGHGAFVSAGAFTPGILTGITLVQRETNGY